MVNPTPVVRQAAAAVYKTKPIVGMLRKGLVLDLSVALGLGMSAGYFFWYGYHIPAIRKRDAFYLKLQNSGKTDRYGNLVYYA